MQHSLKNKITSSVWLAFLLLFHLLTLEKEFYHFLHRLSLQTPTRKFPLEISLWNSHCSNISHTFWTTPSSPRRSSSSLLVTEFQFLEMVITSFQGFLPHSSQTQLFPSFPRSQSLLNYVVLPSLWTVTNWPTCWDDQNTTSARNWLRGNKPNSLRFKWEVALEPSILLPSLWRPFPVTRIF